MEPENLHDEKFHTARVYGKKHLRFLSCFQVLQRKRDEDGGKGTRRETHVLCADDPIRSFPEPASPDHQTMDVVRTHSRIRHTEEYTCRSSGRKATRDHLPVRSPIPRYPCPQTTVHAPLHGAPHPDRVRVPARRGKVAFFPWRSMNAQRTGTLFTWRGAALHERQAEIGRQQQRQARARPELK